MEKLRKKLAGALDDNGTVLPHACEVRWTGMRQGMVSYSPLPPADVAPAAARVAAPTSAVPFSSESAVPRMAALYPSTPRTPASGPQKPRNCSAWLVYTSATT